MKIIILGKNGQLGQELIRLSQGKYEVYAFARDDLDVTNFEEVKKIITKLKPDFVINTTVIHATLEGEMHPDKLFSINSTAVMNIAKVCHSNRIRFITYSSDYVFDGMKGAPYVEDDPQCPRQQFGISKYMGEIMALNYNPDSIIIRTCGVYGGLTGSRLKGNFVLNMLKEAASSAIIEVSSEQIVNPTYSVDLAQASMKLIKKNPPGGIYHLANSGFGSWAEFTKEIMRLKNKKTKIKPVNRKGTSGGITRPIFSALQNKKAASLGIIMPTWQDALRRYLDFLPSDE